MCDIQRVCGTVRLTGCQLERGKHKLNHEATRESSHSANTLARRVSDASQTCRRNPASVQKPRGRLDQPTNRSHTIWRINNQIAS
jgi:hypothetical protein